jgi:ComF family protein
MKARAVSAAILDAALPRSCVLCGTAIRPGAGLRWPICEDCSSRLGTWGGERCPSCGLPLISEAGLCMRCRGIQRSFDSIYPLFSYSGLARELVSAYKKGQRRSLAPFFADILAKTIAERWPDRVIVPVPPRPGKLRTRGWDQVEEIARVLEARGLPVARVLERAASEEQKSLGKGARGANARAAYSLRPRARSPERPLVVDDVVTTCATIEACAAALRLGGALSVRALVIAAD